MELKEIEFWEKQYLEQILFLINEQKQDIINGLLSMNNIKKDWINLFKYSSNKRIDFNNGLKRIFYCVLNRIGVHNSSPIGADLFFETYNAFLHISINSVDKKYLYYQESIFVHKNQTSYKSPDLEYEVSLPTIYSYQKKVCLTYFINIVYEELEDSLDIKGIFLICVPNGELFPIYKNEIINASKNKGKGFRYLYTKIPFFSLLENKPLRIKKIYLSPEFSDNVESLLGINL